MQPWDVVAINAVVGIANELIDQVSAVLVRGFVPTFLVVCNQTASWTALERYLTQMKVLRGS